MRVIKVIVASILLGWGLSHGAASADAEPLAVQSERRLVLVDRMLEFKDGTQVAA